MFFLSLKKVPSLADKFKHGSGNILGNTSDSSLTIQVYTPGSQFWVGPQSLSWVVPPGVSTITVTATAGGGLVGYSIAVTSGETLDLYIGAAGVGAHTGVSVPGSGTAGGPTYIQRSGTDLARCNPGSPGSWGGASGGTSTQGLTGSSAAYQSCNSYPAPLSGAQAAAEVGSTYGYGGYSNCDWDSADGGVGYLKIVW